MSEVLGAIQTHANWKNSSVSEPFLHAFQLRSVPLTIPTQRETAALSSFSLKDICSLFCQSQFYIGLGQPAFPWANGFYVGTSFKTKPATQKEVCWVAYINSSQALRPEKSAPILCTLEPETQQHLLRESLSQPSCSLVNWQHSLLSGRRAFPHQVYVWGF